MEQEQVNEMLEKQLQLLSERVDKIESFLQKLVNVPQLSNLAGRDTAVFVARLKGSIEGLEEELANDALSDDERKEKEEDLARTQYLVSPALSYDYAIGEGVMW